MRTKLKLLKKTFDATSKSVIDSEEFNHFVDENSVSLAHCPPPPLILTVFLVFVKTPSHLDSLSLPRVTSRYIC